MNLVLLETSGNQNYIFATNKLRENVGASHLTSLAGTLYVLKAVAVAGGPNLVEAAGASGSLRAALLNPTKNPPMGPGSNAIAEILVATSGKALVLVSDEDVGRTIVSEATREALLNAPGLDLAGAVSTAFQWSPDGLQGAIAEVHSLLECVRRERVDPSARFPGVPFAARCATSGLPASSFLVEDERRIPISATSKSKRAKVEEGYARMGGLLANSALAARSLEQIEATLEKGEDWIGIIHADGNGVGLLLRELHHNRKLSPKHDKAARACADLYRSFSCELEEATEAAFSAAAADVAKIDANSCFVLALVVGGDDLTAICRGSVALRFAHTYLREFEACSKAKPTLNYVTQKKGLTACAGVAITKSHFPFHSGYDLAEELLKRAKEVKKKQPSMSALDFHVLFDSTLVSLEDIRERRLKVDGGRTSLTCRPYVVSSKIPANANAWAHEHNFQTLRDRASHGGRASQAQKHALREALFEGVDVAEQRASIVIRRHAEVALLLEPTGADSVSPKLFFETSEGDIVTRFLDLLEMQSFWTED